jgi:hypothetical protein
VNLVLTILAAVFAAVGLIGGILLAVVFFTGKKSLSRHSTAEDSGYATPDGYSVIESADGGGD